MNSIPDFQSNAPALLTSYILYRVFETPAVLVPNVSISELFKQGNIGFFYRPPKDPTAPGAAQWQQFIPAALDIVAVLYGIEGYQKEPTHYSTKSKNPAGPFRVFNASDRSEAFAGVYTYDNASGKASVGDTPLPPGCHRVTYLLVNIPGQNDFSFLRLTATLRSAIVRAVEKTLTQAGKKPPAHWSLRDLCGKGHFWRLGQASGAKGAEFDLRQSDGRPYAGQGPAYVAPLLFAEFIFSEERQKAMEAMRDEVDAFYNKQPEMPQAQQMPVAGPQSLAIRGQAVGKNEIGPKALAMFPLVEAQGGNRPTAPDDLPF